MKERVETLTDSFIDFKGDIHHFVIAAVSIELPTNINQINPDAEDSELCYEVTSYTDYDANYVSSVCKGVKIGLSICHPNDKFDENIGILKAVGKARAADYALFSTKLGYINTTMIQGLLRQEANYIKDNPATVIAGYEESRKKYLHDQEMKDTEFTALEMDILDELHENPSFLDKVLNYFKWIRKQS